MAVAGNRGGAGGARNIARAQRRPLPGPPSFARAVPSRPGALTRPRPAPAPRWTPAPTQIRVARAVARGYARQGRAVSHAARQQRIAASQRVVAAARQREEAHASQRRAVARAAYRQKPLAKRRAAVAAREPAALAVHRARERGRLAAPGRYYESLGPAVARAARQQQITGTTTIHGTKVPRALVATDPAALRAAGFTQAGLGEQLAQAPIKALVNAPKDIRELATTTPTSLAHMGVAHAQALAKAFQTGSIKPIEKAAGEDVRMFVTPYKQLGKDPVGFATKYPVTTYLMFAGGPRGLGRVGGRAAGKVARITGRQA